MQSDAQAIGVHRDVAHRQMQAAQLLLLLSAQCVQRVNQRPIVSRCQRPNFSSCSG